MFDQKFFDDKLCFQRGGFRQRFGNGDGFPGEILPGGEGGFPGASIFSELGQISASLTDEQRSALIELFLSNLGGFGSNGGQGRRGSRRRGGSGGGPFGGGPFGQGMLPT